MAIARQSRYSVKFGYASDGGTVMGEAPETKMAYRELEFALAMVDPFNHEKWMCDVRRLRRRGDKAVITTMSESDSHGIVHRAIVVVKA